MPSDETRRRLRLTMLSSITRISGYADSQVIKCGDHLSNKFVKRHDRRPSAPLSWTPSPHLGRPQPDLETTLTRLLSMYSIPLLCSSGKRVRERSCWDRASVSLSISFLHNHLFIAFTYLGTAGHASERRQRYLPFCLRSRQQGQSILPPASILNSSLYQAPH